MKKPEWTIDEVINELETDTCYECAYGCIGGAVSCEAECDHKDAVIKAIEYLKVLQTLNNKMVQIPAGYKFVIERNWERGTDENAG